MIGCIAGPGLLVTARPVMVTISESLRVAAGAAIMPVITVTVTVSDSDSD
jgi:hypothetical protein